MAQLLVRNLDEDVKLKLKQRAARNGSNLEQEVRAILRDAVKAARAPRQGLGSRIAARFAEAGLTASITEQRGQAARPVDFSHSSRPAK